MEFFDSRPAGECAELMRLCWSALSPAECELVQKDIVHFFLSRAPSAEPESADATAPMLPDRA